MDDDKIAGQKNFDWAHMFNSVTSLTAIGVHVVDLETREMYYANYNIFKVFNVDPCDYDGRKCYEAIFGRNLPCDNCRLEGTKKGLYKQEIYLQSMDKTLLSNTEISQWNGKDVYIEYITDITSLKKDQEELYSSEKLYLERMKTITQSYPNALGSLVMNLTKDIVTSQKRRFPFIKEQKDNSISGYLKDLEVQMSPEDFIKYKNTFSRDNLLDVYNHGAQVLELTHLHHFLDRARWITTTGNYIVNPVTKDIEVYVIATDVTEKITYEMIVQELINLRYDLLAFIYTKEGKVDFRYSGNEFKNIPEIEERDYEKNRYHAAYLFGEEGSKKYIEYTEMDTIIKHINESKYYYFVLPMEVNGRTFYKKYMYNYLSGNPEIIIVTIQDVTEILEKEEKHMNEINKALLIAEEANRAKTIFLSSMSHDMRTPMNCILGLVTLMEDEQLSDEVKENLHQIQLSGKYLLNLINDTLDLNKIEANKIELHPVVSDAYLLTENIMVNGRIFASEKGVNLTLEKINAEDFTHEFLLVDESRIEQIFMNLISNAVKFTPKGGSVRITIERLETNDEEIVNRYKIIDSGIGMSEEFQKQIFEPFSQEGRASTNRESGTGLGMTIVKRLVELMGGSIEVKSRINVGTTITLVFRFKKYTGGFEEAPQTDESGLSLSGKRILLCEDHPMNSQIVVKLLEKKGVTVDAVNNGKEGIRKFTQSENGYYDLILMDVRMPVMDGVETTMILRDLDRTDAKSVPIIAMTANTFEQDVKTFLDAGMNDHIAKPINVDNMYMLIEKYIK